MSSSTPLEKTPVDYAAITPAAPLTIDQVPHVPEHKGWDTRLHAWFITGAAMVVEALRLLLTGAPRPIAVDIETAGLGAKSFDVRCITVAWESDEGTTSVLVDPSNPSHKEAVKKVFEHCTGIVMHNAAFDTPPLVQHGFFTKAHVDKIWDTIVIARMAFPDPAVSKNLENLACMPELLGSPPSAAKMQGVFKTAGCATQSEGFERLHVGSGAYRIGAMADTLVTLRLLKPLLEVCVRWLTETPFTGPTVPGAEGAQRLIMRELVTNRVMLWVNAKGFLIDTRYLDTFTRMHEGELSRAERVLVDAGLDADAGNIGAHLVAFLDSRGELPAGWPRTPTGGLKADKKTLEKLAGHPLVQAQQKVSELRKIRTYLEQVAGFAQVTGRVHPQTAVLGASRTGRMSVNNPALQQFPSVARGILVPDEGTAWTSVDWSAIEPVTVANCAGDHDFLHGFNEQGADLYRPIVEQAGVDRKTAKVVLLGAMYGQGRAALASSLGVDSHQAGVVHERVFSAMPRTKAFLETLRATGEKYRRIMTADGRLLPIPSDQAGRPMGYKATNYFTQGTAYSVLSEVLNRVHEAGYVDAIKFAIHDELVIDSEAVGEVRRMMETPPDWLETFAGTRVVLRTDANQLHHRWHYV